MGKVKVVYLKVEVPDDIRDVPNNIAGVDVYANGCPNRCKFEIVSEDTFQKFFNDGFDFGVLCQIEKDYTGREERYEQVKRNIL